MFNHNKELYGSREDTENAIPCMQIIFPRNKNHRKSISVS